MLGGFSGFSLGLGLFDTRFLIFLYIFILLCSSIWTRTLTRKEFGVFEMELVYKLAFMYNQKKNA